MNENQQIKYFLYARRSVEKRDKEEKVASVESQLGEMRKLAAAQGLTIVGEFTEEKSAKEPYVRTEFTEMVKQIYAGKADGLLVWKMDRLARNAVDEGTVKYLLQKGIIKNIKASDRDWYPEDNVLLAAVEFGVAVQYSIDLAKHIRRGQRACAEGGTRPNLAPIGYKNTKFREPGKPERIVPDPDVFPILRKAFDHILTGRYMISDVWRLAINEWGLRTRGTRMHPVKKMSQSHFYALLQNPFYYGEYVYGGVRYKGEHTPMISKEEHLRVLAVFGKKGGMRPQKYKFTYTGIMKCAECGASITAVYKTKHQKNGNVHHYIIYHCTKKLGPCNQRCLNEKELIPQIEAYLAQLTIPKEFHDWAMAELEQLKEGSEVETVKMLAGKKKLLTELKGSLEALLDMRIKGEIGVEMFSKKKLSIEYEIALLEDYLANADKKKNEQLEKAKENLSFARKVAEEFKNGDEVKKREILQLIGWNHLLKDRKLYVSIQKPLQAIGEVKKVWEANKKRLEPQKSHALLSTMAELGDTF